MKLEDKEVAEAWLEKLLKDRDELAEHVVQIEAGNRPADVDKDEQKLIDDQLKAIRSYLRFLDKRLAIFNPEDARSATVAVKEPLQPQAAEAAAATLSAAGRKVEDRELEEDDLETAASEAWDEEEEEQEDTERGGRR